MLIKWKFFLFQTLELLAEVAVLEEEVVRLEEKVVNCRQGLYEEAVKSSSQAEGNSATLISRPITIIANSLSSTQLASDSVSDGSGHNSNPPTNGKQSLKKLHPHSPISEEIRVKENQSCTNSRKTKKLCPKQSSPRIKTPGKKVSMEKNLYHQRLQVHI